MKRPQAIAGWTILATVVSVSLVHPVAASPFAVRRGAPHDDSTLRPADANEDNSDEARREAAAAFSDGEAAFERGDYAMAARRFEHAQRLSPHQWTLYNLALSRSRAGDPLGAWHAFDELGRQATQEAERHEAERERDALLPLLAVIEIRGPVGARTCIDDTPVPVAPGGRTRHVVLPGVHRIATTTTTDDDVALAAGASFEVVATDPRSERDALRPWLIGAAVGSSLATAGAVAGAATSHRRVSTGLAGGAAVAGAITFGIVVAAIVKRSREHRARPNALRCSGAGD